MQHSEVTATEDEALQVSGPAVRKNRTKWDKSCVIISQPCPGLCGKARGREGGASEETAG